MTCLIGLNMGNYAIVAADKKELYIENDKIIYSNNDADKIVSTGIGLITGAGFAYTLEKVKWQANSADIGHTDELMEIIQEGRYELANIIAENNFSEDDYLNTCWMFTYLTGDRGAESDDFSNQNPIIRLCLYHPRMDEDHFVIRDNQPIIIFPTDIPPERIDYYHQLFINNIKGFDELPDMVDNLAHNVFLIIGIIDSISKETKTVSRNCDIGVTFIDGTSGLSANMTVDSNKFNFQPLG